MADLETVVDAADVDRFVLLGISQGASTDAELLARPAALDSTNLLAQPSLLAEVDGQLVTALGLSDGTVIADPFHHTADLIDLLRARAHHLAANRPATRSGGCRLWSRLQALAWR